MDNEALKSLDSFGSRKFIVPAEVRGRFRLWRTRVYFVLLAVFLGLPWLRIGGLQAVRIDIPDRHFTFFGQVFLAHDSPLVFLVLAMGVLILGFATALWGRVWCGWACPQTVFIDAVYRRIEIWIEGGYIERRRSRAAGFTWPRFFRSSLKWAAYVAVSSLFAHSFIAYFSGSRELIAMMRGSPEEHWTYFLCVTSVTALLTFNFGWFREQFCIIMCPYGRFQSVLMDHNTVTVMYDESRGEPRKGVATESMKRGDCVSCNRCVEVCPTGIDIRNGVQMECIGCTACIDACDEIMDKVKKPRHLIGYRNLSNQPFSFFHPRALVYLALSAVCAVLLIYSFVTRTSFSITLLRAQDTPYQMLPGDLVMNHFKAHLINQASSPLEFEIVLPKSLQARGLKVEQASERVTVAPGASVESHFFLTFPKEFVKNSGEQRLTLKVREEHTQSVRSQDVIVVGPAN